MTSAVRSSVSISWEEMPIAISFKESVMGFPIILTDFGRPRSFRGKGSWGQETCLLITSFTEGIRRIVICGFAATSEMKAGEIRYLNTVFMVAVSGSGTASSGRSKSPDAMRGWSMSRNGPVRMSASAYESAAWLQRACRGSKSRLSSEV